MPFSIRRDLLEICRHSPNSRKAVLLYGLYMLGGSVVWEFAHMPLYTVWYEGSVGQIISYGLHCSLGDVIIALSSLIVAMLVTGQRCSWLSTPKAFRQTSALAIVLGVIYTIFSEYLNVEIRQSWAYAPSMPRLPWLGTGLSPIAQWLVLPSLGFWWLGAKFRPYKGA